jgi:glycosyltransferase involved in cell wall biosynthesis
VLFFEPASGRSDRRWREPGRRVRPGVTVYTLPPVYTQDERYQPLFLAGQNRLARFINRQLDRHRFRSFLLWTTSPAHVHLLDSIGYDALVYDCDRDWSHLPDLWEGSLARAADVVFAASPDLADRLSPCSSNVALLPNGVNYSLFANGGSGSDRLLSDVTGPVFGWTGTLYADLDLGPAIYAAAVRPQWTFLFVGRVENNPQLERLECLPNVIIAGPRPLVELPDWLARCDVCINLLRKSAPYSDIIPSRIYEYLSTGTPVVSMLWPDQVELFPDVVYGAYNDKEFISMCRSALDEDPSFVSQRRQNHGCAASWSNRAGEVVRILSTAGLL